MKVLLDTNIVIYREDNRNASNYSIGHLFRWLDKLKYDKVIHPLTKKELAKFEDALSRKQMEIKLTSYLELKSNTIPDADFFALIHDPNPSENNYIDDCLLYELYLGHVDIFITEDRRLRNKAFFIGCENKVFSINSFISKVSAENPELIEYKALSVKKTYFGYVNVSDSFFDSFRSSYKNFDKWFARKCNEEAYICRAEDGKILGFLYLKLEDKSEHYPDIIPHLLPKKRLKIGTFKVESTGFRLGERFIKIIFDNALKQNAEEIYVTLFTDREELNALKSLLLRWGFYSFGVKKTSDGNEDVLLKTLHSFDPMLSPKENFPNIKYDVKKYILPIYPKYHTSLLPDSKLKTEDEIDFINMVPHRYALQKVYISWANLDGVNPGDIILFYRIGDKDNKKYSSVLTTVCVIDEIFSEINSEKELFDICQNRSVFSDSDLHYFWEKRAKNLSVIKFIYIESFTKRLTLEYLWNNHIVKSPYGPRPFHLLTDAQYDKILADSKTHVVYADGRV